MSHRTNVAILYFHDDKKTTMEMIGEIVPDEAASHTVVAVAIVSLRQMCK